MWCEREADGVLRWFPSIRLRARQPQIPVTCSLKTGSGALSMNQIQGLLSRQPMLISGGVQEASLQQLKVRPPVHLTLDELQAIDLSFCLPAAPLVC
jgi:hypothetical protein